MVERRTFSSIRLRSAHLGLFSVFYGTPTNLHRQRSLHHIDFAVDLPQYHCRHFYEEDRILATQRMNNTCFTSAIGLLFILIRQVSLEESGEIAKPIDLCILGVTLERGTRVPITPMRLLNPIALPRVGRLRTLRSLLYENDVRPAALVLMASRLPELETLDLSFNYDYWPHNHVSRLIHRFGLATALPLLREHPLKCITMNLPTSNPKDQTMDLPTVLLPQSSSTDHLCICLCALSQFLSLRELVLTGPAMLSAALFRVSVIPGVAPHWPHLVKLDVTFSAIAPSGRWYLVRDPHERRIKVERKDRKGCEKYSHKEYSSDEADESSRLEQASCNSIQSDRASWHAEWTGNNNAFADAGDAAYDEEGDSAETQYFAIWRRQFRVWPSAELEYFLISAAQAAGRMPALKLFKFLTPIDCCQPTKRSSEMFGFAYTCPNNGPGV